MEPPEAGSLEVVGVVAPALGHRDRALVDLARAGDRDAFAELVAGRADRLLRTAVAITGNAADAHDAAQEALVAAWVHLPQLRDSLRFDAWLNRTLVNACRQVLRRRRPVSSLDTNDAASTIPDSRNPGDEMASIRAAFRRIPIDDRHILALHHLHGLPVVELSRQLGIPVGTAKSRLWRARRSLARALEAEA